MRLRSGPQNVGNVDTSDAHAGFAVVHPVVTVKYVVDMKQVLAVCTA